MATRKTSRKTRKTTTPRRRTKSSGPSVTSEAQREISAVFLGALALLLTFACFNFGGSLVTGMFHGLRVVMGYSAYLLPIVFGSLAWMLFQPDRYSVKGLNFFGFVGFLASLSALFHIGISGAEAS